MKNFDNIFIFIMLCFFSINLRAVEFDFIGIEVAPWASQNKISGEYVGIFPDLVEELEIRSGHKINITLSPYARINREIENNRQDCTVLIVDEKRSQITVKGGYFFSLPVGVIPKKSIVLKEYNDLYDKSISLLRGAAISHKFNSDKKLVKQFDTDYMIILRKLEYGRIDAIAGVIPTIQYLAKQENLSHVLGQPLNLSLEPVFLQCSKTSKNIDYISDLNKAIESMVNDKVIEKIFAEYF